MDTDKSNDPYILQQPEEDALYTKLQHRTLEEAQRLSGKVWTDYNVHDPGVTLAEAANYALAELDYKLGFPLADYLSEEGRPFEAERFGLFPSSEVYATSPVTEEDYRRMLLDNISGIDDVSVLRDPETGGYAINIIPSPFSETGGQQTVRKVEAAFQRHRNLCDWLEKVDVMLPDILDFEAEIEICPGEDATDVLARLYWCILHSIFHDGPETEHDLYKILCNVEGVKRFRTCYLMKDGIPQTRISGYSLRIPRVEKDFGKIKVFSGKTVYRIDADRFVERLKGYCLMHGHGQKQEDTVRSSPSGTWRDIFSHCPIAQDLPECYRLAPDKGLVSSFETYTRFYDWVIRNGLAELEALPRLLSLATEDMAVLRTRDRLRLKSRYLDFLDRLYGVESHPDWLSEEDRYGETPAGTVRRRMNFLRNVPRLERDRAKGRDITSADGNAPTVKEHFCLMLGIDPDDGRSVSNVLPSNNLRLLEHNTGDDTGLLAIADRIDSLLISDSMMQPENARPVKFMQLSPDEEGKLGEYAEMRAALPFFNENLITDDLFRGGTHLENYRIVKTGGSSFMLIYRHREHGGWTNLGQDTDPEALERLANILRRFLRELNRRCETLYVVEPVLVDTARAFEVILVLPSWTSRFHSTRFRTECRRLLRGLVPAHLSGKVCWLSEKNMRRFEVCYHHLMRTLSDSRLAGYRRELLETVDALTERAEEVQDLDDTD